MGLFTSKPLTPEQEQVRDFATEFEVLLATEASRIKRMEDYRKENAAARESSLNVQTQTDYGRATTRRPDFSSHRFALPFGKALNVKHSFRIAGRLPDAIVDRLDETPEERHRSDVMEKMWWGIVRESNGDVQFADGAWDSSELGAAVIEAWMDVKKQMPLFRAIDPAGFLAVRGVNDPHDFQRTYRFWKAPLASVLAEYRNRVDAEHLAAIQANPSGEVQIVQVCDQNKTVRFAHGFSPTGNVQERNNVELFRLQHDYGFCPYVVIPNLGPERAIWGWSDYEFVRELIDYLCKHLGREADILRFVASGAMMVKGSKLTPAAVKKLLAEGGVIPVGKEGDIEPVEAPQVPAFAEAHADRVLNFFEMLGFAPKAAWGDGNAGSGSDRGLQLGPMLELTSMKQINWGAGLGRLGSMLFRMIEMKQAGNARYAGVAQRGGRRSPFRLTLGPDAPASKTTVQNELGDNQDVPLSMNPVEIIGGDYNIRFSWPTRLDPDDPAYVASELQKFQAGVQSARTTLEKFGVESPEDELKLIEQENEDHPWLRQGMLKLIEMQLGADQQGANDGSQNVATPMLGSEAMQDTVATDADVMSQGLPGAGTLFGKG